MTNSNKKFHGFHLTQRTNNILSRTFSYLGLVLLSLIWIIPILWIVLSAFRTEVNSDGDLIGIVVSNYFPTQLGFDNFINLFTNSFYGVKYAFPMWMLNTLIIAVVDCIVSTFLVLSVAYCMSKLRFKLRKAFMNITMILGLFPGFMSMIAVYFLLKSIGLAGNTAETAYLNIIGLILAYSAGAGMGFQIAKGFFDVLPTSLVESAKLDGCSNFKIFLKIILPMSKPIIIYTALMSFTGPWMDFIFAKVIIGDGAPECWTVSVGLYSLLFGAQSDANFFTQFAAGCVCIGIPIVALFMFLQKYYVEGVTAGAVKG
ncbi:MAG: ABC transporter permease subunit [Bacilli bacterium]